MNQANVRRTAWAMPLTSPSYPRGPYRFVDREFLIISYRTDPELLAAVVPEPLLPASDVVKFEFIRMPDSTGFGNYTESGQVIPVTFEGKPGSYVHSMFLDDDSPIAGGREIWGFPKKLGSPVLRTEKDTLVGTLDYGSVRVATGTMGYKHRPADEAKVMHSLGLPNWLLKIIPDVDCEGPAALELFEHALAPVARLPVLEVLGGLHLKTDLTIGLGRVVHDYLKP